MQVSKRKNPYLIILDVTCSPDQVRRVEWCEETPGNKDIIIFLFTAFNQEHDSSDVGSERPSAYSSVHDNLQSL